MRILLTGKDGQVGWELARALPAVGEVVAFSRKELDLADPAQLVARVREVKPDVIVNAAAYTAVDKAESEPDQAFLVNAAAPRLLAEEAKAIGAVLIHYSTDYVFDGTKQDPYTEDDAPNPVSAYGKSKLAGEEAIQATNCRHLIFRTSWVYASRGKNFVMTILRLAKERPELHVVDDQHGAPTWARSIADVTAQILRQRDPRIGTYHLTAAGETTWCGFAREILRLSGLSTPVKAISTAEYPTPAKRPMSSLLSTQKLQRTFQMTCPGWRAALELCLNDL